MYRMFSRRAVLYYLLGWLPIYYIVGYLVHLAGWDKTIHFLIYLVIATVIFVLFAVPLILYMERKQN